MQSCSSASASPVLLEQAIKLATAVDPAENGAAHTSFWAAGTGMWVRVKAAAQQQKSAFLNLAQHESSVAFKVQNGAVRLTRGGVGPIPRPALGFISGVLSLKGDLQTL